MPHTGRSTFNTHRNTTTKETNMDTEHVNPAEASADTYEDILTELHEAIEVATDEGEATYEGELYDEDGLRDVLDNLPLEVTLETRMRVLFSTGGPSCYMEANVARDATGTHWERVGTVTMHHTWGAEANEFPLYSYPELVEYFDRALETMG